MGTNFLQTLFRSGRVSSSRWRLAISSNALRMALVRGSGGAYLDTDVISLRRMPDEPEVLLTAAIIYIIYIGSTRVLSLS